MNDLEKKLAEVDAAEADVRSATDRLVDLLFINGALYAKAGLAIANMDRIISRSVAAALLRTEEPTERSCLIFLLEALGPPEDYETLEALAIVADEDWEPEIRAYARQVLEDTSWKELRDERDLADWQAHSSSLECPGDQTSGRTALNRG